MKKILSLLLALIMVLGMCQTVSAAVTFDVTAHKYFLLPINNHVVHYSYSATDEENSVTYEAYDRRVSGAADANEMTVDANGTITLFPTAQSGTASTKHYRVKANEAESKNIYTIEAYNNSFDDSSLDKLSNAEIQDGSNGNKYIKGTSDNSFSYAPPYSKPSYVTVLEADVNFTSSKFEVRNYADGQTFVTINHNDVSEGWHNVKLIMNWESMKYYLMLDNILSDTHNGTSITSQMTSTGLKITSADGVDNLKFYGTSLNIPHSISVTGNYAEGNLVTAQALQWVNDELVTSQLEYEWLRTDTAEYDGSLVSSDASYTISAADVNKYLVSRVRVKESDTIYGDWIYSEPQLVLGKAVEPFVWGEDSISKIYAPHGDDVYKFHFTHNNKGQDSKDVVLEGSPAGVTATNHSEDGYVLTVTGDAATSGTVNTKLISSADESQPKDIEIVREEIYNFDSYINGDTTVTGFDHKHVIKEETNGNKYLDYDRSQKNLYSRFYLFGIGLSDTIAIDFDILTEESGSASLYFGDAETAIKSTTQYEIAISQNGKLPEYKDVQSGEYKKVDYGWNHVKIFLDLKKGLYSTFIEDIPLCINNPIPGYADGKVPLITNMHFITGIDNFTFSNVTPMTPVVYNYDVSTAAVGVESRAVYDFYMGRAADKCTTFEWYISDNYTTGYELVSTSDAYTPKAADAGKYLKVKISPETEAFFETCSGEPVETTPKKIRDVVIGDITLKVNDVDADINSAEITSGDKVVLTIPASYAKEGTKNVIFALAQYDGGSITAMSAKTPALTASGENVELEIKTGDISDSTVIKVLVFDAQDLTPLNNVIFLR